MTEKIAEYAAEGAEWPLAANILDPVRCIPVVLYLWWCSFVLSKISGRNSIVANNLQISLAALIG
jgi:hypothetical protein